MTRSGMHLVMSPQARSKFAAFLLIMLMVIAWPHPASGINNDKGYGEPYALAGKRIVFTTWYWVRPGQHDWLNEQGESVYAKTSVMAGPFDAHFNNIDGPWGVRLIAEQAQRGGKLPVKPEFPWEAGGITIEQMLPTPDGKIIAWGDCFDAAKKAHGCYLESTDGVNWIRPKLGLVEFEGSKENNLLAGKQVV